MSDFFNKYPYTDFHELNLDWVIERVKKLTEDWIATREDWNATKEQFTELYNYVHDYFDNLDVQEEINNKLDEMAASGELMQLIADYTGWVTPEMFGAKGDGIEDDTQAVLDCFDHGGNILGLGTYLCRQMIEVKSDSCIKNINILSADNADHIFKLTSVHNVEFSNCTIIGDDVLNTSDSYHKNAIVVVDSSDVKITGCDISHMGAIGIFITDHSTNCIVSDNYLHDNANDTLGCDIIIGYASDTVSHIVVKNNRCESPCEMGILTQGENDDILIDGNTVLNKYGYGICVYGFYAYNTNIRVINNYVKDIHYNSIQGYYNGMGIYCVGVHGYICSDNNVVNVLLDRPDVASPNRTLNPGGITCGNAEDVTIEHNIVMNSKIDGISITTTVRLNVSDNDADGDVTGMFLSGENVIASGNIIKNKLSINNALQCNDMKILNNYVVKAIEMRTSTYIAKSVVVSGNTIIGSQVNILGLAHCDNMTVSDNIITSDDSFTGNKIGIRLTACTNANVNGNVIGHNTLAFYEGIRFETASSGSCSNNLFRNVSTSNYLQILDTSSVDAIQNKFNTAKTSSQYIGVYNSTSPTNTVTIEAAPAAPTAGWHHKGSLVFNTGGGTETGWVCTATGTPGTWSPFTLS